MNWDLEQLSPCQETDISWLVGWLVGSRRRKNSKAEEENRKMFIYLMRLGYQEVP